MLSLKVKEKVDMVEEKESQAILTILHFSINHKLELVLPKSYLCYDRETEN